MAGNPLPSLLFPDNGLEKKIKTKGNNSRCMSYSVHISMYTLHIQWMGEHKRTLAIIASVTSAIL